MSLRHLLVLFLCVSFHLYSQTSGGPDPFGYTWRNSLDPDASAPEFEWLDVSHLPPVQGLADDNSVGWMYLGFRFPYYWGEFDRIKIGSNGWVSFDDISNIAHPFPEMITGTAGYNNFLAPMMCDLNFTGNNNPGKVYFYTNFKDKAIIQYDSVPYWVPGNPPYSGSNTFQVVLDSTHRTITFHYLHLSPIPNMTGLGDLTIGIENITGDMGFQIFRDQVPPDSFSIRFYYPDTVTYQVTDLMVKWNMNPSNGAEYIIKNNPYFLKTSIRNAGNVDVYSGFQVNAQVLDENFQVVHQSQLQVDTLMAGEEVELTFPDPFVYSQPGHYLYRTQVFFVSDQNPGNDFLNGELIVIDTSLSSFTFGYDNGAIDGVLSWTGGDAGAGIYIYPPYHPVVLEGLEFEITQATRTDGFIAQLLLDDGPSGSPGTLLYEDTVPGISIFPFTVTRILFPNPITIDSGGFYIGWIMDGDSCQLGTTSTAPISYRTYEIINGIWETYRSRPLTDFKIRAIAQGNCNIHFQLDTAGTITLCEGDSLVLAAPQGFDTYQWSNGATTTSITVTSSGTYNVTVSYTSGCSGSSSPVQVNVVPTVQPVIALQGDSLIATSALAYQWFFNGNPIAGENNQVLYPVDEGFYHVVVTDINGCQVASDSIYYIPAYISGTRDEASLIVFPNPSKDMLQFELSRPGRLDFHCYDLQGRLIFGGSLDTRGIIDLSQLLPGVYFMELRFNGTVEYKKIIKAD